MLQAANTDLFNPLPQTCRLRYFYALFIAEVGADRPFLKAGIQAKRMNPPACLFILPVKV